MQNLTLPLDGVVINVENLQDIFHSKHDGVGFYYTLM